MIVVRIGTSRSLCDLAGMQREHLFRFPDTCFSGLEGRDTLPGIFTNEIM